ncbi:hypothetical protein Scep_024387 [Stephania cephalantha]|uniref:Uncharacterized protein n=1 Tax=Stephania cephalantha TaxID=152367 RepID=A0AAP0EZB3_9MAGN
MAAMVRRRANIGYTRSYANNMTFVIVKSAILRNRSMNKVFKFHELLMNGGHGSSKGKYRGGDHDSRSAILRNEA